MFFSLAFLVFCTAKLLADAHKGGKEGKELYNCCALPGKSIETTNIIDYPGNWWRHFLPCFPLATFQRAPRLLRTILPSLRFLKILAINV